MIDYVIDICKSVTLRFEKPVEFEWPAVGLYQRIHGSMQNYQ